MLLWPFHSQCLPLYRLILLSVPPCHFGHLAAPATQASLEIAHYTNFVIIISYFFCRVLTTLFLIWKFGWIPLVLCKENTIEQFTIVLSLNWFPLYMKIQVNSVETHTSQAQDVNMGEKHTCWCQIFTLEFQTTMEFPPPPTILSLAIYPWTRWTSSDMCTIIVCTCSIWIILALTFTYAPVIGYWEITMQTTSYTVLWWWIGDRKSVA